MTNLVFDVQRFSVHDGPGIRTTVFLKGCNLRCAWCHNPESLSQKPSLQVYPHKCIHCGRCVTACPNGCNTIEGTELKFTRERCNACGACAKVCYAQSREIAGKPMTVGEIMEIIQRDAPFYKSTGGGVTFSGGEPLLQPDFLLLLLQRAKELNLHTSVDTAGNVPWERFEQVTPLTDLFLYDFKVFDPELHQKYTGVSNGRIIENLRKLGDGTRSLHIRIPVIPTVNDNEENMLRSAELLSEIQGIRLVELLPFHTMGEAKYKALGLPYSAANFGFLPKGRTEELTQPFRAAGLPVKAY